MMIKKRQRTTARRMTWNIADSRLYTLAIGAFGVATFHFVTEWLVFGTVKPNRASIGPLVIGCESRSGERAGRRTWEVGR